MVNTGQKYSRISLMPNDKIEWALYREFRAEDVIAAFPIYIVIKGFAWIPYLATAISDPSLANFQQLFVITSYMIFLVLCFFIGKWCFSFMLFKANIIKNTASELFSSRLLLVNWGTSIFFRRNLIITILKKAEKELTWFSFIALQLHWLIWACNWSCLHPQFCMQFSCIYQLTFVPMP